MKKILVIQTAFIGDVILATSTIETLAIEYPESKIDILVRNGNEGLLNNNPHINKVLIWDKTNGKYKNLMQLGREIKSNQYDLLINLQRFASTGYLAFKSKAKMKVGFEKNPLSRFFDLKIKHDIGSGKHEIERNYDLIKSFVKSIVQKPKLYPSSKEKMKIESFICDCSYVVLAPASVWFTKQLPKKKWEELIENIPSVTWVYLIGGDTDIDLLNNIIEKTERINITNLAGELSLLDSAELIKGAQMTYVNDSAPLHIASAMNAPVTAFFCSTLPSFGFGPLSDVSIIKETSEKLDCRPCGLHGLKSCPKGHFKCGTEIDVTLS